ncbi:MAG: PIN domain-containing protein [Stenomitos frigidus ULC029]
MATLPPFLILLDISALMASGVKHWQEFSRIGDCFIPKAVLEEIQLLCDHAIEPAQARTAKEFVRFFPESGWKATTSIAQHAALKPTEGHILSKKTRLSLATAQAAYGLARNRAEALVIVAANDQGLIQRLRMLNTPNLCGLPLTVLVQWSRTARKPPVVTNQLHAMRLLVGAVAPTASRMTTSAAVRPRASQPVQSQPRPTVHPTVRRSFRPAQMFYNLLTLAIIAIAVVGVWRVVHPPSFDRLWQQITVLGLGQSLEDDRTSAVLPSNGSTL